MRAASYGRSIIRRCAWRYWTPRNARQVREHPTSERVMMMESSGPQEILYQFDQLVMASVEILVPVIKKFTLNYHGADEPSGQEYSITPVVLPNPGMCGSAPYLPLRMTMGSGDNADLVSRCFDVLKAGCVTAKGELVIDHQDGAGESASRCIHLVHVNWFDAVEPVRTA